MTDDINRMCVKCIKCSKKKKASHRRVYSLCWKTSIKRGHVYQPSAFWMRLYMSHCCKTRLNAACYTSAWKTFKFNTLCRFSLVWFLSFFSRKHIHLVSKSALTRTLMSYAAALTQKDLNSVLKNLKNCKYFLLSIFHEPINKNNN